MAAWICAAVLPIRAAGTWHWLQYLGSLKRDWPSRNVASLATAWLGDAIKEIAAKHSIPMQGQASGGSNGVETRALSLAGISDDSALHGVFQETLRRQDTEAQPFLERFVTCQFQ